MKRATCLAVTVLLVLGCSAAFAQVTLGLLSSDGVTQYCDYETFAISAPYAAGIHVASLCGFSDGALVGFRGSVLPVANLPVTGGQTYLLADSIIDSACNCFSGEQGILVTAATAVNPRKPKFGWEFLFNVYESFDSYLGSWGYLTTIPADGPVADGTANRPVVSSFHAAIRNIDMMKR